MEEDFRIEISHAPNRLLSWTYACYNPLDVEATMHRAGTWFDSPEQALNAARAFMAHRASERFLR